MIAPVANIQHIVAEAYGIDPSLMKQPCRKWVASHPRQVAMYLARGKTRKSFPCLGRLFGGLDHSTVKKAMASVERRMASDPAYRANVEALRKALGE